MTSSLCYAAHHKTKYRTVASRGIGDGVLSRRSQKKYRQRDRHAEGQDNPASDMTKRKCPLLRSLSGLKRTCLFASQMSAFDRCCRKIRSLIGLFVVIFFDE